MRPNPHIKYFKPRVSGDDIVPRPAERGGSAIYYETSGEAFPIRPIQMLESGVVLAASIRVHSWLTLAWFS
jgi:hypothetical protein